MTSDNKKELNNYISSIELPNYAQMEMARKRLDSLAKPPGSLGKLEDIAMQLAGICGKMFYDVSKRCVIVISSDNGVVEEGVASTPQSVTYAQTVNSVKGLTGIAVLAKQFNADLIIVDVGINSDTDNSGVKNKKIRKSTWNMAKGEAMTYDEAVQAVLAGVETAVEAVNNGYKLVGVGEIGIGNTTTSSAVLCSLTGIQPEQATGKGAGLCETAYRRKIEVIKTALNTNAPNRADPVDVLAKVGGFDIAAMAGVFIGCSYMKVPVVIDGFISMVAALVASRLNPTVRHYMFASHSSFELGFMHAARTIGIEPCLNLNMRLGEGSGCPLMFAVIDAACAVIRDMGTFEQANIDDKYLDEIRLEESNSFTVKLDGE